jgi:hypothetical protein
MLHAYNENQRNINVNKWKLFNKEIGNKNET